MISGTYVYCLLVNARKPRVPRGLRGLPHSGPVRLLGVAAARWLVVADVPLERYGDAALAEGLADLDWVARAAVAHERVVETFLSAQAILPMKLFTIFASDDRACDHLLERRAQIDAVIARVASREEWGIRVVLGRVPAGKPSPVSRKRSDTGAPSGAHYLQRKKDNRDELTSRARRARAAATEVFDALARHASEARKRPATEMPATGGPLVLDAAFLVPRTRSARLKTAAARHARALAPEGFDISLTGPWPPYSFMQD
jgi:hypothetical protein